MNYNLLNKLTFKTVSYRKNFDLTFENENFITEHEGNITKIRINEQKPPLLIGEYGISVWNIGQAKIFGVNLIDILKNYTIENSYREINHLIDNRAIDLNNINNLILIQNFILHPDYRKKNITDEFIEFIFRDYYFGANNILLSFVKPIQDILIDWEYLYNEKEVIISNDIKNNNIKKISAKEYYDLDSLTNKNDVESNEYKLFAVASKCGFERIDDSYIFKFNPNKITNRLLLKRKEFNETLI